MRSKVVDDTNWYALLKEVNLKLSIPWTFIYLQCQPLKGEFHTWSLGLREVHSRSLTDNFSEKDADCHDRMCRLAGQEVKRMKSELKKPLLILCWRAPECILLEAITLHMLFSRVSRVYNSTRHSANTQINTL